VRSPVVELLGDLDRALRALGLRWYLFGAQAAILHGAARLTADVDATVDAQGVETEELLKTLSDCGFSGRSEDPVAFAAKTRVLPLVHDFSGLPCDLVLAGPGLEPLFLQRSVVIRVDDLDVPVASAEDIVVMKILAGRAKDLDDAAAVIAAAGNEIDFRHSRTTLGEIEQALDRSDLIVVLDQLMSRHGHS